MFEWIILKCKLIYCIYIYFLGDHDSMLGVVKSEKHKIVHEDFSISSFPSFSLSPPWCFHHPTHSMSKYFSYLSLFFGWKVRRIVIQFYIHQSTTILDLTEQSKLNNLFLCFFFFFLFKKFLSLWKKEIFDKEKKLRKMRWKRKRGSKRA